MSYDGDWKGTPAKSWNVQVNDPSCQLNDACILSFGGTQSSPTMSCSAAHTCGVAQYHIDSYTPEMITGTFHTTGDFRITLDSGSLTCSVHSTLESLGDETTNPDPGSWTAQDGGGSNRTSAAPSPDYSTPLPVQSSGAIPVAGTPGRQAPPRPGGSVVGGAPPSPAPARGGRKPAFRPVRPRPAVHAIGL